jgi:hypothetical protein
MATDKEEKFETIKDILEKIDPMEAAIMLLGGTAASNGVIPPLTRLLSSFTGSDLSKSGSDIFSLLTTPGYTLLTGESIFTPGWQSILNWLTPPVQIPQTEAQAKVQSARIGLFCSGAIEAMIMYKLVSNPETFKQLISIPGSMLSTFSKPLL